jgi:hypothetical protein
MNALLDVMCPAPDAQLAKRLTAAKELKPQS